MDGRTVRTGSGHRVAGHPFTAVADRRTVEAKPEGRAAVVTAGNIHESQ